MRSSLEGEPEVVVGNRQPLQAAELTRGRFEVHVASADGRWLDTVLDVDPRPDMAPVRLVVHGDGGQEFEDREVHGGHAAWPIHVLVLNQEGSRARHEARFSIRSEQVTDLGRLELR